MLIEPLASAVQEPTSIRVSDVFGQWHPSRWHIGDESGQPVRFGPAGFVLTVGRAYQVMLAEPVMDAKIVGFPNDFVRPGREVVRLTHKHTGFLSIPFRVRVNVSKFFGMFLRPGIYPRELTIECTGPDGECRVLEIPVLFRRRWTWFYALVLVLLTLGSIAVNTFRDASKAPDEVSALFDGVRHTFTSLSFWGAVASLAALAALKIVALDYIGGYLGTRRQGEVFSELAEDDERVA